LKNPLAILYFIRYNEIAVVQSGSKWLILDIGGTKNATAWSEILYENRVSSVKRK
jgi:hypothetical protein